MTGVIHTSYLKYLRAHSVPEDVVSVDQLIQDLEDADVEAVDRRRLRRKVGR